MSVLGGNRVQNVLDALAAYELSNRRSPTVREMAKALGVGVSTAHLMIREAADAGAIQYDPGIPRSIRVAGERCELCGR